MPNQSVILGTIDLTRSDTQLEGPFSEDLTGAGAGTDNNNVVSVQPEMDLEIVAIQVSAFLAAFFDPAEDIAEVDPRTGRLQLSTRDAFGSLDQAGVLYEVKMGTMDSFLQDDTTDTLGAGGSSTPDSVEVWLGPETIKDNALDQLAAGQDINLHWRNTRAANVDNQLLRGQLMFYGRDVS